MRPTKILIMLGALALTGGMFSACTQSGDENTPSPGNGIEITVRAPETLADRYENIEFTLYVFSREESSAADYVLTDKFILEPSGQRMEMKLEELEEREYRFLFLGLDDSGAMLMPVNFGRIGAGSGNAAFATGDKWSDLRLMFPYSVPVNEEDEPDSPSIDNYYDVVDMRGSEIISDGRISGDLQRIVGQLGFDFFKGTSADAPLAVDKYIDGLDYDNEVRQYITDPNTGLGRMETEEEVAERVDNMLVGTVMDRIYMVEMEYSGMSDMIRFDEVDSGFVPVGDRAAGTVLVQRLKTTLNEDFGTKFRYYVPRTEQPAIISAGRATGDARIKGFYFMPTADMTVTLTIHYYDTTYLCDTGSGTLPTVHDESCFDKREFSLTIPQAGSTASFGVSADKLTLTKAAIPCNRIIDIRRSGGFIITDHQWTLN